MPLVAIQKDFGYSDVTISNNQTGKISQLFTETAQRLDKLKRIFDEYHN